MIKLINFYGSRVTIISNLGNFPIKKYNVLKIQCVTLLN